jgi:serine/threonine protein kinase
MDYKELCINCFAIQGDAKICPKCGYHGEEESGPTPYLKPGTILENKYLIGQILGQGGFGITYLAWDINLGVKLAIKEYFPQQFAARENGKTMVSIFSGSLGNHYSYGLEKFLLEARTLAQFEGHPNIVSVRDYFQANNTAYFVMSYVEGLTLKEYLNNAGGTIPYQQAKNLIMPVLDALKAVHAVNVLHRDISPDNIFINEKGQIVLLDFGSARQAFSDKGKSLSIILKPGYAPEEQYRSKGNQGPWTDIYALAATLYRLITGWQPPEALERLTDDKLVPPSRIGADIDETEEQAILKALSVRAEDRYQRVEDFQAALLGGEKPAGFVPPPIQPEQPDRMVSEPSPSIETQPPPLGYATTPVEPKGDKKKIAGILIGLAALLIAGIAILALVSSGLLSEQPAALVEEPEETIENVEEAAEIEAITEEEDEIITDEDDLELIEEIVEDTEEVAASEETVTPAKAEETATEAPVAVVEEITDTSGLIEGVVTLQGGTYTGQLLNGKPHGTGMWLDHTGNKYFGQWKDGAPNGPGERSWANGDFYKGSVANWKPHGHGTMIWADGLKYEGGFKNGLRHGMGKLIYPDGKIREYEWHEGEVKN